MDPRVIAAPLIGGVIGYITNYIAIRMLFHPHKAIYVGKWRVPFTPGLIPSQKGRIARAIGETIDKQLLNSETILAEALSEQVKQRIRDAVLGYLRALADNPRSLRDFLIDHVYESKLDRWLDAINAAVSEQLTARLLQMNVGNLLYKKIGEKIRGSIPKELSFLLPTEKLRRAFENAVNDAIRKNALAVIEEIAAKLESQELSRPMSEILNPYEDKFEEVADWVVQAYCSTMKSHLEEALRMADIAGIVERKILRYDTAEMETILFALMKRELNAIVYLGAVLGALMGFINLLI